MEACGKDVDLEVEGRGGTSRPNAGGPVPLDGTVPKADSGGKTSSAGAISCSPPTEEPYLLSTVQTPPNPRAALHMLTLPSGGVWGHVEEWRPVVEVVLAVARVV